MLPVVEGLAGAVRVATVAPKVAEVAVATTSAVEVAAAVPKVAEIATTAPQALAGGIEAGLGDAHATLGHLAEVNTDLASPLGGATSAEATPTAVNPVSNEGSVANNASIGTTPEQTPSNLDVTLTGIEKATAESGAVIEKNVESKITQWDTDHPQPDANTDPEKFNEWVRERATAQTSAREDATVNAALQNWDKENPAPDKTKDPEAFNKWVEERADQEKSLKKEVSGKEGDKTTKEGQKKELSAAEIAERMKRLNELNMQITDLNEGIKSLRAKPDKTADDKIRLADFTSRRDGKINEVKIIKAELGDAITMASPIKKIALISALITAAGVMMMAQATKG